MPRLCVNAAAKRGFYDASLSTLVTWSSRHGDTVTIPSTDSVQ